MAKCNEPHPDNDSPGAFYRPRDGTGPHWSGVQDGIFCDLPIGHEGSHQCTLRYKCGGEVQKWGGDMTPNSWCSSPFFNLEIDTQATQQSTGTGIIYRIASG